MMYEYLATARANPTASARLGVGSKRLVLSACLVFVSLTCRAQFEFDRANGRMKISLDGKPFASYVWRDPQTTRPYFKQVRALDGSQVTRHHPPQPGDYQDHKTYHPGVWWGFGDVGGHDYWRMKARIIGGDFIEEPRGGRDRGGFAVRNRLLTRDDRRTFCEQVCRYTLLRRPEGILMICESTFRRDGGDFWLGDQEEMGLAVRVATSIAVQSGKGGHILNREGLTDLKRIRTHQSDWCDYSGPLQEGFAGIMIMNDPRNFRRPWWHAVATGLLVANPLGESELHGRGKRSQNVLVKRDRPFRLRYGLLVHRHDGEEEFDRASAYRDFLNAIEVAPAQKTRARSELPQVPEGFDVGVYAREPMIYKPTSVCFDARGRLMLGQGPQYPKNLEDTPPDRVLLLIDRDNDGVADASKVFAQGFNSIQGLAWKGNDLYVANAPELTVVRDLDGDDEADEYVMVYTDLGNREHALHGLNWGPDGKLYMTKGNSKGHNQPKKYGYLAPRPFRELWDVVDPPGAPDSYPPKTFSRETYKKTYHHWDDDWGREGGVLRCDPLGANLEIVARGLRNPWDIAMDGGFNWLGTDNDQNQGDRIVMPFFGAQFGWGHPYSSHWTGEHHLPTVPVSGPVFPGSGTGIIYYARHQFPEAYRNVFFIDDWLQGTFVYRPRWEGALRQPVHGHWEPFARRGTMIYRPTDLEFGPDGALYICGWGGDYHYEPGTVGSWIYRVTYTAKPVPSRAEWFLAKHTRPYSRWSCQELLADLGPDTIPVWRVHAQDEIVRRGSQVQDALIEAIESGRLTQGQETWAIWALGRTTPLDTRIDHRLNRFLGASRGTRLNLRIQALRILAYRIRNFRPDDRLPREILDALEEPEPRIRLEAVEAIWQARQKQWVPALIDALAGEEDRLVFYAAWSALRDLTDIDYRKTLLNDPRPNIRLAALLGLLERHAMTLDEVMALAEKDPDPRVQEWAMTWALNPLPPEKMPNTRSRIELEQSISVGDLMKRSQTARTPKMRRFYLTMLSRSTYESRQQWRQIRDFYRQLKTDRERALVLVPIARENEAMPLLWEALAGGAELARSAVKGFVHSANRAESSPSKVAQFLLDQVAEHPGERRIPGAIEALSRLKFDRPWHPAPGWDKTLTSVFNESGDLSLQHRILILLSSIDPTDLERSGLVRATLTRAAVRPDRRLYSQLLTLTSRSDMEIEIPTPEPATIDHVLPLVPSGNGERGRELFFSPKEAAGCFACHRIQGQGHDFAPDLSGIGLRSELRTIVQSILNPSAVITEGYRLNEIETKDSILDGAILQETDSEIEFVTQEGRLEHVRVGSIIQRRALDQSSMPGNFSELLSDEQIADLTAFLLSCNSPAPAETELDR